MFTGDDGSGFPCSRCNRNITPRMESYFAGDELLCAACWRREETRREKMAGLKPTDSQVDYATALGIANPTQYDREQLSDLIGKYRIGGHPASSHREVPEQNVPVDATVVLPNPSPSDRGVRYFFTKVVGVTHENQDGSSRQEAIESLNPADKLELQNEDENPGDANAVAVYSPYGQQVGYLSRALAEDVIHGSEHGKRYVVYVKDITGEAPRLGVNIVVIVADPGISSESINSRLQQICDEALPGWHICIE